MGEDFGDCKQKASTSARYQTGKLLALETVLVNAIDLGSHAQVETLN